MLSFLIQNEPVLVNKTIVAQDINNNKRNQSTLVVPDLVSGEKTRLIVQEQGEKTEEFILLIGQNSPTQPSSVKVEKMSVVELNADRQEYDQKQQIITAEGKVIMRFNQAVLTSNTLTINLVTNQAIAEGDVTLTRGNQVLKGTRFEYFFSQNSGVIYEAKGEVDQATSNNDFDLNLPTELNNTRLRDPFRSQPLQNIRGQEGITWGTGQVGGENNTPNLDAGGQIRKIRFQADRIDFEGETWKASNVRLTNDPFSPPELEIRADTATLNQLDNGSNELRTTKSRVVFDQKLSLPIFQNRLVFSNRSRQASLFQLGYDGEERGGVFVQGNFSLIKNKNFDFELSPQVFLQKSFSDGFSSDIFGVKSKLNFDLGTRTSLRSSASLTSFDFSKVEDNLRANVRLRQSFGNLERPYNLSLEYTYRDRLFNGSQGFQTVQSSVGGVFSSPNFTLGSSGINLSYQLGIQQIEANTDRLDLLKVDRENDRLNLTRYQGAIAIGKTFSLWTGKPLPATKDEGLRYRREPVVPYLNFNTSVMGVSSYYSNNDTQNSLSGTVSLQGQFGNFARNFFDYTNINVGFTQVLQVNKSPFLFDRVSDAKILSFGISQQVYGPFLIGFQSYLNLDTGQEISTDYILEYSRRTHNIILRYNPVLQVGSIGFKITDFNWTGDTNPFDSGNIKPVIQGVER
jgi:lipopolysaccharide export system protein LptA